MPITKSAIKKQRTDKHRTQVNRAVISQVRTAVKKMAKTPSAEAIRDLYSTVDVAVKKKLIKLNTASRMKAGAAKTAKAKLETSPFAKTK